MSLITRCPACKTMFKVVPDQLRISEGWVRCGHCDEIFDASRHLVSASPKEAMPVVEQLASAANNDGVDALLPHAVGSPVFIEPEAAQAGCTDESWVEQEHDLPDTAAADAEIPQATLPDPPTPAQPDLAGAVESPVIDHDSLDPDPPAELPDVSFLRPQGVSSIWYKPLMRAGLALLSLVLLLGLLGQIAFHERDRIAALQPALKPWLLAMCEPLNCTLSPLRRIEAIVIDGSSFARIEGESFRLNFTLMNTATTALAVPAVEFTLTDSLDQPVVRRVLLPSELGDNSGAFAAGSEWPVSLALAVKAGGGVDRVAGYRLLAFYP